MSSKTSLLLGLAEFRGSRNNISKAIPEHNIKDSLRK